MFPPERFYASFLRPGKQVLSRRQYSFLRISIQMELPSCQLISMVLGICLMKTLG